MSGCDFYPREIMDLVDRARFTTPTGSDYALARALQVSKTAVSNWTSGIGYPDAPSCIKLAKMCGVTAELALALRHLSLAQRAGSEGEILAWRRIVKVVRGGVR